MKPRITLFTLLTLTLLAAVSHGTIRTVSPLGTAQYTTIGAAVSAAVTGDTILIAPATYSDFSIVNKRLYVIGAGWDLVTVSGTGILIQGATSSGTVVEGLRVETNWPYTTFHVSTNADSVTIRRCHMRSSGVMVNNDALHVFVEDCLFIQTGGSSHIDASSLANSNVVVRGCILANNQANPGTGPVVFTGNNGAPMELYNCTMLNFTRAFNLTGVEPLVAINNIFYDWTGSITWGSYVAGSIIDYIAADASAPAFPGTFTNTISLGADNPFVNYTSASNYQIDTSDVHLNTDAGGLALTNTGHPSILNLDSTRSDFGAYGGQRPQVDDGIPAYPFTISLTLPPLIESDDSLDVNSAGRVGPRY